MLTLPKLLDQPIVIINKPTDPFVSPYLQWATPRSFIEKASEYAANHSIYVPPLFREHVTQEHATDNALTPVAFSWAITVARRAEFEVEMFDSLYDALNHVNSSSGVYVDRRIKDLIELYARHGLNLGRNFRHAGDPWEKGLFENFDFHIASAILFYRYGVSISDVLSKIQPDKIGTELAKVYSDLCWQNAWTPSDFCNEAFKWLGMPLKNDVQPVSTNDEYRALVWVMDRETTAAGKVLVVSELERDLLKIQFSDSQVGYEFWSGREMTHA